jgi:hypothetical protein
MSKLTDFLHKLVDRIGDQGLHAEVDELAKDETPATEKAPEEDTNAAE